MYFISMYFLSCEPSETPAGGFSLNICVNGKEINGNPAVRADGAKTYLCILLLCIFTQVLTYGKIQWARYQENLLMILFQ